MTDESVSDSCGSEVVRKHKHSWRSEGSYVVTQHSYLQLHY